MSHNSRVARLRIEQEGLVKLTNRSEFIEIQEVDTQPGLPPEKYIITFTCRGISHIDEQQRPHFAEYHQVSLYLSHNYPRQEPQLKWLTPIWHPNIEHLPPNHVCTNNIQNHFASKPLEDLVVALGEMVQYKRYHAAWTQPWPLDQEAAKWVREYAEPNRIVGPNEPIDKRQLLREYEITIRTDPDEIRHSALKRTPVTPISNNGNRRSGIELGNRTKPVTGPLPPVSRGNNVTASRQTGGLVLGKLAARRIPCPVCNYINRVRAETDPTYKPQCENCHSELFI